MSGSEICLDRLVHVKKGILPSTHQRYYSPWFPATDIVGENDTEYLVQWAGKDPTTGRKWASTWV
jgi:hypothetical protein